MAARSRTSLLRVLHFAYLLKPMPVARSAEMSQTVISVAVTGEIKKQNALATTQQLLRKVCEQDLSQPSAVAQMDEAKDRMGDYNAGLRLPLHRVMTKNVFS